jgi:hypothetical protein
VQAVAGAKLATEHASGKCSKPGEASDCIKICMKLEPSCGATECRGTKDHHPFYVKAPRGEPAPIGTSPEGHPIRHSPGLRWERATLMALPQSASVGARGRNFLILPLPGMPNSRVIAHRIDDERWGKVTVASLDHFGRRVTEVTADQDRATPVDPR